MPNCCPAPMPPTRQAYARTILRCVARPVPHPICALTDCDEMKGRIAMMKHDHNRTRRLGRELACRVGGRRRPDVRLARARRAGSARPSASKCARSSTSTARRERGEHRDHKRIELKDCEGEAVRGDRGDATRTRSKKTKIVLCGKEGASKAQNADDARESADPDRGRRLTFPPRTRQQIVATLKAQDRRASRRQLTLAR